MFGGKPVALMGASPGGFGGKLLVSRAGSVFNEAGEMTDEAIRTQLAKYLAGFAAFIAA